MPRRLTRQVWEPGVDRGQGPAHFVFVCLFWPQRPLGLQSKDVLRTQLSNSPQRSGGVETGVSPPVTSSSEASGEGRVQPPLRWGLGSSLSAFPVGKAVSRPEDSRRVGQAQRKTSLHRGRQHGEAGPETSSPLPAPGLLSSGLGGAVPPCRDHYLATHVHHAKATGERRPPTSEGQEHLTGCKEHIPEASAPPAPRAPALRSPSSAPQLPAPQLLLRLLLRRLRFHFRQEVLPPCLQVSLCSNLPPSRPESLCAAAIGSRSCFHLDRPAHPRPGRSGARRKGEGGETTGTWRKRKGQTELPG